MADFNKAKRTNNGKKWYVNIDEAKRQGAELALDYQIDSYDVDIVVNKNNTFDITETIESENP